MAQMQKMQKPKKKITIIRSFLQNQKKNGNGNI